MEFLSLFESFESDDIYSALYVCPINLDESHCYFIGLYSDSFQEDLIQAITETNKENYNWIVKLDDDKVCPGCIIKGDNIKNLAESIYSKLEDKIECRIVYGTGKIESINETTIHKSHGDLLVNIGRKLDSLKGKAGIYPI